ncbi:MAG: DUF5399 family protein [Verrucomicrobia bacterium]|nr:DUF5399 family protein [Verrucomicrobiota bacterium]
MKAVTIDKLNIKDHLRWAQDQEALESIYVTEAQTVAQHPELVGLSMIYPSKFEELFELAKKNQHWACFTPPKNYHVFGKRFFSYRLFPSIHWEDEEEGGEEPSNQEEPNHDLIQAVIRIKKMGSQTSSLFEKDKSAMINLLESIRWINKLLKQINARKLQYQKG